MTLYRVWTTDGRVFYVPAYSAWGAKVSFNDAVACARVTPETTTIRTIIAIPDSGCPGLVLKGV